MASAIVETRVLGKTYGLTPVLHETDFKLACGGAATIVGGNGSGKSTLLAIIAGLIAPSEGCALVFGKDTRRFGPDERRRIGMLSHQSFLYPNLTARENLEFYARLYNVTDASRDAEKWLEQVGLADSADERVRTFSRGMEQRLAAARAMLHGPSLLLLDEPFAALDSDGVARIKSLLKEASDGGCSMIATAHAPFESGAVEFDNFEIVRGQVVPYAPREEARPGRLRSLISPRSQ